jgi:hypothetical protein
MLDGDNYSSSSLLIERRYIMNNKYTEADRKKDFDFFLNHYDEFYNKYGHCCIAIRFENILGVYRSIQEAIDILSNQYEIGDYIVQECNGDETGYTNYVSSWQLVGV